MKSVFFPIYDNPYQKLLADSLADQNVLVEKGEVDGAFPILVSYRANPDIDIAHFHWLDNYIFKAKSLQKNFILILLVILQLTFLKINDVKIVWTVHNLISHESRYPRIERIFKHIFTRMFCDHIIIHCQIAEDLMMREFKLPNSISYKVSVVPHGHYIDVYSSDINGDRPIFDISPEQFVYLYFGLIRPYKKVDKLIESFRSISEESDLLIIAGEPVLEEQKVEIQDKTQDNERVITRLEHIPSKDVTKYFDVADVVVLPFKKVLTSGSAILAASMGKATILPRDGCLPETFNGAGAIFFNTNDEECLKEALKRAKSEDLQSMGDKNYNQIKEHDWEGIAAKTLEIYRTL